MALSVSLVLYAFGTDLQGINFYNIPTGTDWVRGACRSGSYQWKAVGLEGECVSRGNLCRFPKWMILRINKELIGEIKIE